MTSATGSSRPAPPVGGRGGFTFFEVIVTVAVLATGLVFVYQSLLTCLDAHVSYRSRLAVSSWMDEKVWETQERLLRGGEEMPPDAEGELELRNRNVSWRMSIGVAREPDLYRLNLSCSWKEGSRAAQLSREVYVLCVQEEEKKADSR